MRPGRQSAPVSDRDHSVISGRSRRIPTTPKKASDQRFCRVGMPGFEPGISGPPDQRPGPNWATSRVVHLERSAGGVGWPGSLCGVSAPDMTWIISVWRPCRQRRANGG